MISEGRNRQIHRMAWAVGRRVHRLVRVAIGSLALGDLPPGECRILDKADCERLVSTHSPADRELCWPAKPGEC
jgi:16S rRNA U516 pseudouridylate synthase RsuA-like enzyme